MGTWLFDEYLTRYVQALQSTDTTNAPGLDVETIDRDLSGGRFDGWYCVSTRADYCHCGVAYLHCSIDKIARIIVWPEIDHEELLSVAIEFRDEGADPHIVPYERSMGRAIEHDAPEAQAWLHE
jgi:hypothetical protein